jgi:hypothetical protein
MAAPAAIPADGAVVDRKTAIVQDAATEPSTAIADGHP